MTDNEGAASTPKEPSAEVTRQPAEPRGNVDNPSPQLIHRGMGATLCFRADSWGCTVIALSRSGHKITVQRDRAIPAIGGYRHEADPHGQIVVFYRSAAGKYENRRGLQLLLGGRSTRYGSHR